MSTAVREQRYRQSGGIASPGADKTKKDAAVAKRLSGERILLLVVAAAIFAVGILYVGMQNVVMEKGFVITDLKEEIETLNNEIGHLNLTISELKAPDRIESIALNTLGMKKATQEDMVFYVSESDEAESAPLEETEEETATGFMAAIQQLFQRD